MEELIRKSSDPADDYYKLLGCDENSTTEQIEAEFKVLAKKHHPDKVHESAEKATAEKKFVQIDRARKILTDKDMRKKYDQWRSGGFKLVVTFDEWLAIQPRVHTSVHWITTQKHTPCLPEPDQSEKDVASNEPNLSETCDESPPSKRPRTDQKHVSSTLLEFRRGSEGSNKISKFRTYQE